MSEQLIRIHLGENDRYQGRPLYAEILQRCLRAEIGLAVVYRGFEGFGASTRVHRPGMFGRSTDAPIVVTAIDTQAKIQALLPALDEIVDEGLIAISTVEVKRFG